MMTVRFGTMPLDTTVANDITYTAAYQADAELIQEFYDSGGGAFGIHLLTRTRDGSPLGRATVPEKYVDWQSMLDAVTAVPTGAEHAKEYEDKVEELLTALFSPSLADPDPQSQLYGGRQIVDIVYTNVDTEGFFGWIVSHAKLRAPRIIVELKNYGGDPKNPEFDQIKGRMNNTIGQLGFLVYRQTTDWKGVLDRAQIAHKGEKFVLPLDDSFLAKLVDARIAGQDISPILRNLYTKVVSG
jgi:hypothetical protein